jgi:hypothetical protein
LTKWLEVAACLNNNSIIKINYHELNKIYLDRKCGFLATCIVLYCIVWFNGSVVLVFGDIIIEKSILAARHSYCVRNFN